MAEGIEVFISLLADMLMKESALPIFEDHSYFLRVCNLAESSGASMDQHSVASQVMLEVHISHYQLKMYGARHFRLERRDHRSE